MHFKNGENFENLNPEIQFVFPEFFFIVETRIVILVHFIS